MNSSFFYPEAVYPESSYTVISTLYGPVICNREDHQARTLLQTGKAPYAADITQLAFFLNQAPERGICLDVGSGYGLFGLAFARALAPKKGACHSFESQRLIAYLAAGTTVLNGVENLYIHHRSIGCTLGKSEAVAQIDTPRCCGMANKSNQTLSAQDLRFEKVPQITIDSLGFKNVYLMRVSLGGMEKSALEGAQATITQNRPILHVRSHKSNQDQLVEFCKSLEYQVYKYGNYFLCIHFSKLNDYSILNSKGLIDALV